MYWTIGIQEVGFELTSINYIEILLELGYMDTQMYLVDGSMEACN